MADELCHPVVVVVEGVMNDMCMELFKVIEIGHFQCYGAQL